LIFTDTQETPSIFISLSQKYRDSLVIGEVKASETELLNKFRVKKFPTLIELSSEDRLEPFEFNQE
jgi:thioredoxin-related protein